VNGLEFEKLSQRGGRTIIIIQISQIESFIVVESNGDIMTYLNLNTKHWIGRHGVLRYLSSFITCNNFVSKW